MIFLNVLPPVGPRTVGRYILHEPIAAGGMATVHLGRLVGPIGFSKVVAIKRLRDDIGADSGGLARLLDEARLTARVQHPNVVSTLDALALDGELFLVMEYVRGAPLSLLFRNEQKRGGRVPVGITAAAIIGALHGLHAAHEARDDNGELLGIIHRDVSPQNIMLGVEGVPHLLDFGVAKATFRLQSTEQGALKGKLGYMAPEQLAGAPAERRVDIHAMGIVLWELLTGQRLFHGEEAGATIRAVMERTPEPPSQLSPEAPPALDAVVLRALEKRAELRFATAREFAAALEGAVTAASQLVVGEYVREVASEHLAHQAALVARAAKADGDESGSGRLSLNSAPGNDLPTELHTPSARASHAQLLAGDSARTAGAIVASMRAPARGARFGLIAFALLLAGVLIAGAIFFRPGTATERAQTASGEPPPSALQTATAEAPPPTPSVAAPTATPAPIEEPPAVDAGKAAATARPQPRRPAPAAGKPGCNPPYVIDDKGIKRYLPECF